MSKGPKKRKDCFLGFHSDFHATVKEGVILGASLNEASVREVCERLKPDFIQIDCKGHPGIASYPTIFPNAYPAFAADPLALWRKITLEYGIALYMHFSGVYDMKYCEDHPEEAIVTADRKRSNYLRLDSRYFEEYFIPQISEIAEKYKVDGFWIDGDCWAVRPDYSTYGIEKFEKATGICLKGNPPLKKGDPYFYEFLEFFRNEFRKTLNHYVDVLHEKHPELEICSNWAFSDHMPEKVSANVDFLSGDLNPANCLNSARYAGRMIACQGMTWDLMSWNFRFLPFHKMPLLPPKPLAQVMQEAAEVIALGGAYQDNISQFPDGSHDLVQIRKIEPLYAFLREREHYCFKAKPIHQAVVFVSTYDRYREVSRPFSRDGMEKLMGLMALLCDAGQSLEAAYEHTLYGNCHKYPVIIVPELNTGLEPETVGELKNYVQNGGSLILTGSNTCRIFAENGFGFTVRPYTELPELPGFTNCDIGHDFLSIQSEMPCYFSLFDGKIGTTTGACSVAVDGESEVFGCLYNNAREENGIPFAQVFGFGKGKIAVIGMDLGMQYGQSMQYLHRELIRSIADRLYTPIAKIEGALGLLEIVLLEKEGRLLLQLVNANGSHASERCISEDQIPPVLDITLSVKTKGKPEKILLQPENRPLEFTYENGRAYVALDRVDVHNVIEIIAEKDYRVEAE